MSRSELPEELLRRIEERLQSIEETLQQKPDQDMVEHWVSVLGWDINKFGDALSDVESTMAKEEYLSSLEDQIEEYLSSLEDQIEELRTLIEYGFEDLQDAD